MQLIHLASGEMIVEKLVLAQSFRERFWGLMGKKELDYKTGLLLKPCSAVHTWFMNFALDIVFLDQDLWVVKLVEGLSPFREALGGPQASMTLELSAGALAKTKLVLGDQLAIVNKI